MAALVHLDLRAIETRHGAIRPAANGDEHAIEGSLRRSIAETFTVKGHGYGIAGFFHSDDLRVEQHRVADLLDALGQDVDEVAIGSGQ